MSRLLRKFRSWLPIRITIIVQHDEQSKPKDPDEIKAEIADDLDSGLLE